MYTAEVLDYAIAIYGIGVVGCRCFLKDEEDGSEGGVFAAIAFGEQ